MKKFLILLCLTIGVVLSTVGCSEEEVDTLVGIYEAVSDLGETVYEGVDSTVKELDENGTLNDWTIDIGGTNEDSASDFVNDFTGNVSAFRKYEKTFVVTGYDVMTLLSSAKSANLSILIQLKDEPTATVCGTLITADNTPYVDGLNELQKDGDGKYTFDLCGYYGIIRKVISGMPNRAFVVHQYNMFNSDVSEYVDLSTEAQFDILTLVDENGNTVGFYCSER